MTETVTITTTIVGQCDYLVGWAWALTSDFQSVRYHYKFAINRLVLVGMHIRPL